MGRKSITGGKPGRIRREHGIGKPDLVAKNPRNGASAPADLALGVVTEDEEIAGLSRF
jgi:hypothetical protein